jgi:two-component system, OmpR family, phosphate regulon sensor histidine kinase PhoR
MSMQQHRTKPLLESGTMNTSRFAGQVDTSLFHVAQDRQSYMNMLYLLVSFPLGLFYFAFLIPGLIIGIAALFPVAVLMLPLIITAWLHLATFERQMAIQWLHIAIAPMSYPSRIQMTRWQRLQAQLTNSMTWKTLAYLLLKFPLGIFSFVITLVMLVLTVGIAIVTLTIGLLTAPFFMLFFMLKDVSQVKEWVQRYLFFALTGFGLCLMTLHLLNGLTFVYGQFARVMLGMSDTAWRLEEAQATAAQQRARAEQAEQRRHELIVNVSHELRTPVASISGHLESLLMATEQGTTALTPAVMYNYLNIAHQEVERLGMLVDDLLSLARMESDELHLNMQPVVASEAIEEVYQTLMPLAKGQRQVTLVRGSAPHLPPILADRQRLIQILLNLVRNAITSTSAGGIVSINLEQADPQHLALIIEDDGIGMSADELEHIFERFYRSDASRTRTTGGFGLGLAIVHDLVTAMGGSIAVESIEGQGSRFTVLLCVAIQG